MAVTNSTNSSGRERFMFFNTLTGLVKSLELKYTTVDLRNECSVTGRIIAVDGGMNIEMDNVLFYDSKGNKRPFASFYIKSRNIRNIHISKKYDALELLKDQLEILKPKKKSKVQRTFKVARAKKYNSAIVQQNYGGT